MLSTKSLCDDLYFFKWDWIAAFNKNGLDITPNTTRVNWNFHTSGVSLLILSTHRNLRVPQSSSDVEIMRKAFSTSTVTAILWVWHLCRMSKIHCSKLDSLCVYSKRIQSVLLSSIVLVTLLDSETELWLQ